MKEFDNDITLLRKIIKLKLRKEKKLIESERISVMIGLTTRRKKVEFQREEQAGIVE